MAIRWSQIQNINITEDEINLLAGLTATATELNELTGFTGTSADLNNLLGLDTVVSNHIAKDFSTAHPIAANSLDGLIIADNTITQSKLAFDVATQAELDAISLLINNLTSDTAVQQTQIDNLYAIVIPGQKNDLADSIQQVVNHIEKINDAHDSSAVSYGNYYTLPSDIIGGVTSFLTIPWDQMKYYRVNDVIRFQDDITPFENVTLTNVDYNLNRIYFNPPVSSFTVADNGVIWTVNELNAQQALDRSLKNNTDYFTGRLTIDQKTNDQALVLNKTADGTTLEAYMLSIGDVAYFHNQGTGDALVLKADSGNDLHLVYGTIASDNGYVLDLLNSDLFRITNVGAGDRLVLNDSGDLTVTRTLLREEGTAFAGTITKDTLTANRVWTFPDRDAAIGMPVYGLGDGLKVLRVNAGETDVEWHDLAAVDIDYNNSSSGLTAVLVQTAIDEIDGNLDTHINTASIHFIINDVGTALNEAWSSTKINNELSLKADITHNHTLDSLSNVNTAGKIAGSILEWDGTTNWIVGTKGEINTASNVGGGEGIFKQKNLLDLEFKSLVAGANITLTPGADTITIASTGGGGGGGGAVGLKARGLAYTDGASAEYNVQVPFVNGNGNTQINTDFEVKDNEIVRFFLDGKKIPLYVDDLSTPGPYYKKIDTFNFELDGNYSAVHLPIEIEVYAGAEPPEVVPSILAGLAIKNEGFYNTSADGVLVGTNTVINLGFSVSQNDVGMVFVNGQFACPDISLGYTHSWRLIENNKIELLGNLTGVPYHVYAVFFEGSSQIDSFGNIVLTLRPKLTNLILENASLQKWSVKVSNDGQLETVQVVSGVPDPVRLKRDDTTIVALTVNNDGELEVNDSPASPGILFEEVYLVADSGLAWKLYVNNSNELYIVDAQGNHWALKNQLGETFCQIKQTEGGTVFHAKYYNEVADLPSSPENITNNVPFTWVIENGLPVLKMWDTIGQKWISYLHEDSKIDRFPVGTILHSFLTLAEFRAEMNDTEQKWVLLNGNNLPDCDLKTIRGWDLLPNGRGAFLRGENTEGTGQSTLDQDFSTRQKTHPEDTTKLGSFQQDALQGHWHDVLHNAYSNSPGSAVAGELETAFTWAYGAARTMVSDGQNGAPRISKETRPSNISVNYFVKIKR